MTFRYLLTRYDTDRIRPTIAARSDRRWTVLIRRWLAKRPRFRVHFTLTSASWLNRVERWFATLTAKQIRRGAFQSTCALEQTIHQYPRVYNEDPKPFVWTETAERIFQSLALSVSETSGTGH
jgi:hypothetical protein